MAVSTVSGLAKATGIGEHYLRQLGVEDKLMVPIGEYLKLITEYNQGLFHRVTTLLARGPQLQQTYRQGQDTARVVTDVTDIDGERTKVAAELHKLRERVEAVVTKLKTFAVS
ncbi:MAG: hypothetical protein P0S94_03745, partial [Simkaniaceae bacterium]|nr:hypothetical protein [Simkaniaceae bacterium]